MDWEKGLEPSTSTDKRPGFDPRRRRVFLNHFVWEEFLQNLLRREIIARGSE